ncbi:MULTISPECIES: transglutaminase domain-containing protein [unclassified Streptomyces]|uniref:transglutaminase domain-containing protein n=1 Tax=unclassified Streptomyces TaxID=2593676 RepID=UPI00148850F3|nr:MULTISPECIES: transglutaminase domain-containing protein [unclassified Streptomyces]
MTSSLLMPSRRARTGPAPSRADVPGSTAPTRILDWRHHRVTELLRTIAAAPEGQDTATHPVGQLETLRRAHRTITGAVRPVYSVQDERPVSEVLRRGRGSCSQRLAVLEAVARAGGTATRVRGLLVDGAFWYPRFPRMRRLVPDRVVLAWPEFRIEPTPENEQRAARWLPASEIFGELSELSGRDGGGLTNSAAETLFEALSRTAIDWDGATACPAGRSTCDLSSHVLADLGHFDSRDELFARHGQTLCTMARLLAEPILGKRDSNRQAALMKTM